MRFKLPGLSAAVLLVQLCCVPVAQGQAQQPVSAAATPAPAAAASVTLPAFQPGWWEYRRTTVSGTRGTPQVATVSKCGDPGKDLKEKMAQLTQKGCRFGAMSRQGDEYHSNWTCPAQGGTISFRSVVTVSTPGSYQDKSETHYGQQVTHSTIVARRLGECPSNRSSSASPVTRAAPAPVR
jgi:hypothetical protein